MKIVLALLLVNAMTGCIDRGQSPLFVIVENGRFGFMDSTGKKVIEPRFLNAGNFSEGLAPVRVGGRYGYINESGEMVIAPEYDFGAEFSDSCAVVYVDGKPFYIDHAGKKLFDNPFPFIYDFKNGRAKVRTLSFKCGIIDKQGNLLVDTTSVDPPRDMEDKTVLQGWKLISDTNTNDFLWGLADTNGRILAPAKFTEVDSEHGFRNGILKVEEDDLEGYINLASLFQFCGASL